MRRRPRRGMMTAALVVGGLMPAGLALPQSAAMASPLAPELHAAIHAAIHAFNTENCAQIYAITAPWKRGPRSRAATIAACAQGFREARREGVTALHLALDGRGHYMPPTPGVSSVYAQPVLFSKTVLGRVSTAREAFRFVRVAGRWYVAELH